MCKTQCLVRNSITINCDYIKLSIFKCNTINYSFLYYLVIFVNRGSPQKIIFYNYCFPPSPNSLLFIKRIFYCKQLQFLKINSVNDRGYCFVR